MKFCTSIHCMDGRIQEPIINFLKTRYGFDYVDAITEPGPNKILADQKDHRTIQSIRARVSLSVDKHGSRLIVISGHQDCAGNPVDESRQREHIKQSITYLKTSFPSAQIIGLWIDNEWTVHEV